MQFCEYKALLLPLPGVPLIILGGLDTSPQDYLAKKPTISPGKKIEVACAHYMELTSGEENAYSAHNGAFPDYFGEFCPRGNRVFWDRRCHYRANFCLCPTRIPLTGQIGANFGPQLPLAGL